MASVHTFKNRNRSILVVGNKSGEMRSIFSLLRRFDYDAAQAGSIDEALEKISAAAPSLVIAEAVFAGMGGLDLLQSLKKTERFARIPVVFVVPLTDAASERRCLDMGAAGCITKPVRAEELYRTVQAILEPVQRGAIRIDARLSVWVNDAPLDRDGGGCEIELSEHGMYVPMDKPYPRNRRLTVKLHIKDRTINAEGSVLYSRISGVGLKFTNLEPRDQEFIRKFIRDEISVDIGTASTQGLSDPWL